MSDRTCQICEKKFKYPALLKRHQNSAKRHCEPVIKKSQREILFGSPDDDDRDQFGIKLPETSEEPPKTPDTIHEETTGSLSAHFGLTSEPVGSLSAHLDNPNLSSFSPTQNIFLNSTSDQKFKNTKIFQCPTCCRIFKHYQSKMRHLKKNKCKKTEKEGEETVSKMLIELKQYISDIHAGKIVHPQIANTPPSSGEIIYINAKALSNVNSTISKDMVNSTENNNTINNTNTNTNTNSTTNSTVNSHNKITNNIIQYISPLGLEDMSFIQAKDTLKIFEKGNNITHIVNNLCNILYSKAENQNFFKRNLSRCNVEYLNEKHELVNVHESTFKEIFTQLLIENLIRLLYDSKNIINLTELQCFVYIVDNLDKVIKKLEYAKNKLDTKNKSELNSAIASNVETMFRSFEKHIPEYIKFLADNPEILRCNRKSSRIARRGKSTAITEFLEAPPNADTSQLSNHLYLAKNVFIERQNEATSAAILRALEGILPSTE